jgi:hypothetical protein
MEGPKKKRRNSTCSTKTEFRANLRNSEKLVIRKCVTMIRCMVMLPFRQTYVQSVESLDGMDSCGAGG